MLYCAMHKLLEIIDFKQFRVKSIRLGVSRSTEKHPSLLLAPVFQWVEVEVRKVVQTHVHKHNEGFRKAVVQDLLQPMKLFFDREKPPIRSGVLGWIGPKGRNARRSFGPSLGARVLAFAMILIQKFRLLFRHKDLSSMSVPKIQS
jgi:hypothetical protein